MAGNRARLSGADIVLNLTDGNVKKSPVAAGWAMFAAPQAGRARLSVGVAAIRDIQLRLCKTRYISCLVPDMGPVSPSYRWIKLTFFLHGGDPFLFPIHLIPRLSSNTLQIHYLAFEFAYDQNNINRSVNRNQ